MEQERCRCLEPEPMCAAARERGGIRSRSQTDRASPNSGSADGAGQMLRDVHTSRHDVRARVLCHLPSQRRQCVALRAHANASAVFAARAYCLKTLLPPVQPTLVHRCSASWNVHQMESPPSDCRCGSGYRHRTDPPARAAYAVRESSLAFSPPPSCWLRRSTTYQQLMCNMRVYLRQNRCPRWARWMTHRDTAMPPGNPLLFVNRMSCQMARQIRYRW